MNISVSLLLSSAAPTSTAYITLHCPHNRPPSTISPTATHHNAPPLPTTPPTNLCLYAICCHHRLQTHGLGNQNDLDHQIACSTLHVTNKTGHV